MTSQVIKGKPPSSLSCNAPSWNLAAMPQESAGYPKVFWAALAVKVPADHRYQEPD